MDGWGASWQHIYVIPRPSTCSTTGMCITCRVRDTIMGRVSSWRCHGTFSHYMMQHGVVWVSDMMLVGQHGLAVTLSNGRLWRYRGALDRFNAGFTIVIINSFISRQCRRTVPLRLDLTCWMSFSNCLILSDNLSKFNSPACMSDILKFCTIDIWQSDANCSWHQCCVVMPVWYNNNSQLGLPHRYRKGKPDSEGCFVTITLGANTICRKMKLTHELFPGWLMQNQ